jgi:hypothetical protein
LRERYLFLAARFLLKWANYGAATSCEGERVWLATLSMRAAPQTDLAHLVIHARVDQHHSKYFLLGTACVNWVRNWCVPEFAIATRRVNGCFAAAATTALILLNVCGPAL